MLGVQAQFVLCGVHAVYVLVRRNMHGALATTQVAAGRVSAEACARTTHQAQRCRSGIGHLVAYYFYCYGVLLW